MSKKLGRLWKSFYYAGRGIGYVIKSERNFRIHIVAACYVLFFSRYYSLSNTEFILLVLAIALVFSAELVNTAIEAMMDLQLREYSEFVKVAKDCAAGAVLLFACTSVVIGLFLFWDMPTIKIIAAYIFGSWMHILILALSLALSGCFIFGFSERKTIRDKKNN